MIEAHALTKQYAETTAVDDLTFTVRPGIVTGFLGPNGAGKSTTMRLILGLDTPTSGSVTVNGRRYAEHRAPLHEVGALLDAGAVHAGRSATDHLQALAATTGISRRRVDEVIELVGLQDVAAKRAGGFSLGMEQRLGIATALLGDPQTIILDEPVNGLDPEGVLWIRTLLRSLAQEGRTVFLSSHLMSEMAQTADHLIVVGRGRLIRDTPIDDFIAGASASSVFVRTPDAARLSALILVEGGGVTSDKRGQLHVSDMTSDQIGSLAASAGLTLLELSPVQASLEEAFLALTHDAVEYGAAAVPSHDPDHLLTERTAA